MKRIYKRLFILLISIAALFLLQGVVNAETITLAVDPDDTQAYDLQDNLFCMDHNKSLYFYHNLTGNPESRISFNTSNMGSIEASTAYAIWVAGGYDSNSIQNIIWASDQWGNQTNVIENGSGSSTSGSTNRIQARSYQYGTVYYGIFSKLGNNPLFTLNDNNDLKTLIDQDKKTYTMGPYTLTLNVEGASDEAKSFLYNELLESNQYYTKDTSFAKFSGISGLNGTNPIFLNSSGDIITFPDFVNETEFYIQFVPDNGGNISETGEFTIDVEYISGITGIRAKKYDPVSLSYKVTADDVSYTYTQNADNTYTCKSVKVSFNAFSWKSYDHIVTETRSVDWNWDHVPTKDEIIAKFENVYGSLTVTVTNSNCPGIIDDIQPCIEIIIEGELGGGEINLKAQWTKKKSGKGPSLPINMYIGGYVWQDLPDTKESKLNGMFDEGEPKFAGIFVELFDVTDNSNRVAATRTDENGAYGFQGLNPLHKYRVRFVYNGVIYQDTYYKEDLSGGYSTAPEWYRNTLNTRFGTINSSPNNYKYRPGDGNWKKAYGYYEKIKDTNGNYISYSNDLNPDSDADINKGAFRFFDAFEIFKILSTNYVRIIDMTNEQSMKDTYTNIKDETQEGILNKRYDSTDLKNSFYIELNTIANRAGTQISDEEKNNIWTFIQDCLTSAYSGGYEGTAMEDLRGFPTQNKFILDDIDNLQYNETLWGYSNLYTESSDQSRNVDFGLYKRDTADLAIQKDVYQAIVKVNGKTHTYLYNDKDADIDDDGNWKISVRAEDYLYNGTYAYTREIRKSEYLYDGSIYGENGGTSAKDLQVYVTYRIVVRNQSLSFDTAVNEIVDYYDKNEYEFDSSNLTIQQYTYIGNRSAEKIADLNVSSTTTLSNNRQNTTLTDYYEPLYLSGIKADNGNEFLTASGGMAYIYLTFKVRNHTDENEMDGRVQMDVNVATGEEKIGKRNLAEINGYTTYYKSGTKVPDYLDNNDTCVDADVSGVAGTIESDSSPGNLTVKDIDGNGHIIISGDPLVNRSEDDTDQAPNVRLVFPPGGPDDPNERTFTGSVFEDERNEASDKAVVGNGKYDDGETKINGVTVQLVELVQEVDVNGNTTGNYLGEYVWYARKFENGVWTDVNSSVSSGSRRYYSGQGGTVAPIISGPGITAISGYTFGEDSTGQYAFKGIPAGDFFVRFIYGDTTQTTLTTADGEGSDVITLIKGVETTNDRGFISTQGLNAKSYNGQDYKSTTYQKDVNQTGSYNGINAYTDYNNQNYNITITDNSSPLNESASDYVTSKYIDREATNVDGKDKNLMYYYNIGESDKQSGVSDAKDVGNVRDASNTYSKGKEGIDGETHGTLVNSRAEVLASPLKVNSDSDSAKQVSMIKELMDNTAMAAQTGVINTEIEKQGSADGTYRIDDIDLGLEERPVAQLELDKKVSNMKVTLQDGSILFDTGKSVTNVAYAEHEGHTPNYTDVGDAYRLSGIKLSNNTASTPELITTYMDEELMYGARIELTYTFKVTNVGEVDYMDNQFYYTGRTSNTSEDNISKTRADTVVDYVSNNLQFLPTNDNNSTWSIRTVDDLTSNSNTGTNVGDNTNLIHTKFINTLNTYNAIVTTKALGNDNGLLPEKSNQDGSYAETQMMLSSMLTPDTGDDSMVYNNLAEIVQVSNDQGRRMKFSIVGNQPMANQSLGVGDPADPNSGTYTKADLVTPQEPDADSAQKLTILPPTGANRNYTLWIIIGIVVLVIIGGSIFLIKKKVLKK